MKTAGIVVGALVVGAVVAIGWISYSVGKEILRAMGKR